MTLLRCVVLYAELAAKHLHLVLVIMLGPAPHPVPASYAHSWAAMQGGVMRLCCTAY